MLFAGLLHLNHSLVFESMSRCQQLISVVGVLCYGPDGPYVAVAVLLDVFEVRQYREATEDEDEVERIEVVVLVGYLEGIYFLLFC